MCLCGRVCSEWRRARSRAAARSRREQESSLFAQLAEWLPFPAGGATHLDKASIIRLTLSYLRLRAGLDAPSRAVVNTSDLGQLGTHAVAPQRDTDARGYEFSGTSCVERVDLIGQSLYDFMHPCDQREAREILSSKADVEEHSGYELFFRIKCTLTPQGRNVNLKSATWKVLHCSGVRKPSGPTGSDCLVLLCQALPAPVSGAWVAGLNRRAFLSRHSPDMRFTYCQPRISQLTGYAEKELLGHSVYQYYHASDCRHMQKVHLSLFSKGQVSTGKYRLLVKQGGYVWAETVATVVYNSRTGQLQSVICINYILSEVEHSDVIFSLEQTESLLKPCSSSPAPGQPLLLQGAALLDKLSPHAAVPADPFESTGYESRPDRTVEEDDLFVPHDTGQRIEVDSLLDTLLEWNSEGQTQPTPQDLETLAPYIPMDGEDFLLSPISAVEGVEPEGQGPLYTSPLLFPNPEMQSPASFPSPLRRTVPWFQKGPDFYTHCSSAQTYALRTQYRGVDEPNCSQTAGQVDWENLNSWQRDTLLSSQQHPQRGHSSLSFPLENTAPPWKKLKAEANSSFGARSATCWWSPGGSLCCGDSVPWAPGHAEYSSCAQAAGPQRHPIRGPHWTVLQQSMSVLPVLSRWECEVNAPLGPSACLLRGSEIPSVLDQATSRLLPMGAGKCPTVVPPLT
ncbi:hypothetical protein JZ751_026953 [Albula glossodonta]|uniref:Hypoxia-inducible factor 1-alpha n=1 Tax=Albula glossodonta TaxID=121402 RepID=A0A8T2NH01_9TELE|nr:hypothetical protein JZ751_026953 [Albula glossodonta]